MQGLITDLFPYHAKIAAQYGLTLMMYEGGTHVVPMGVQQGDDELSEFFIHLNYTPEMGALYRDLLAGW
ncbi:cellulose-binding protein, partial [Arthrospira platensis SPKY1]|nr:cellulose-binding protein [Arthrospira platensis SPKY1]